MDHETFHSLVLRLANVASLRYWNYLNYPHKPQEFAILFAYDISDDLHKELIDMGFDFDDDGFYRIDKTEK